MSAEALYNQVKSGKVKLTDLNDEGKSVLRTYVNNLPSQSTPEIGKQKYGVDVLHPENSPLMQKANQYSASLPKESSKWNGLLDNPITNTIGKGLNAIDVLSKDVAKYAAPDAPYFSKDGGLSNVNVRDDFVKHNPIQSTGNAKLDKTLDFVGQAGSFYTPGAGIGNVAGFTGATESAISKLLPNLISKTGGKIAQKALSEAATGFPLGVGQYQAQGGDNLKQAAISGLEGAALGGGFGALGQGLSQGLQKIKDVKASNIFPDYSNVKLSDGVGMNNPIKPVLSELKSIDSAKFEPSTPKTLPPIEKLIDRNEIKPLSTYANSLYRESSPQNALDLIPGINSSSEMKGDQVFFSNNKDLALGQGTNKGVMIEFNSEGIQGHVNTNKPTWQHSYNNGDAEFVGRYNNQGTYKDAVKSVTIQPDATMDKVTQMQLKRALSNWEQVKNPDGSVSYLRPQEKALNADVAPEPIKLTPKEQAQRERVDHFSRIEDNPVIPNTAEQIQTKTAKEPISIAKKANEAYIKGVDNLKRIDQFDKSVAEVTGKDVKPSDSAYTLGLNSRGSDMISRQILEKNLVDAQGNVLHQTDAQGNVLKDAKGKPLELSLKSVAKSIPKGKQKAFEDYLVAKHSITRMGRGEKVYADKMDMTIQKAQAIVDNYEKDPRFVEAAQKYYQYNQKLGQAWLVDTGILTQQQWDGYLAANPHYVPNNRIFSDLEKSQQFGSKKGFANQTNPVKKAEGSQRKIVSPIESTIENTAKYVKTAKQNEVAQALYRNLEKHPDDFSAWGEIVTDQPKMDVSAMLEKDGIEGVLNDIASGFEKKPDLSQGNIISALVDGKRVHMKIHDPQLLEAMTNLSPQGQHFVMDSIGKLTKSMKVVTTGLNPVFGLTRNIFRDIPMAFIASKTSNNPLVIGKDLLESIVSIATDGKLYNEYKNVGGGHSSSVAADRNLLAQSKEKILPSSGILNKTKRGITKGFHALENLNNAVESAPRLGEFKRLQNGSYDSKVKGLFEANDITVNFNKFGNYTKQADSLFPYVNAAVQGLDKFVRIYKDNPTQAIAKSIGALTMPTIALYIMNHDNPDYQKLSDYTKDNYLVFPKGDGTFFKIAKPRETGIIFSSAVERALQAFVQKDPEAFKAFGATFLTNFLPPGVNGLAKDGLPGVVGDTIAGPIQSLASNKDFLGRPIVSGTLDKLSPSLQYDSKTSDPAKKLGSLIGYSPKKIDFLIKSYGGIIGQLGIPATTQGSTIKDTLIKQITTDPNFSNDISADFYKAKDKAERAKADSKVTGEQLKRDLTPMFNKIGDVLSALRKQSNSIQNDRTITKEEKVKKLDAIQKQTNDIQSNFLKITK